MTELEPLKALYKDSKFERKNKNPDHKQQERARKEDLDEAIMKDEPEKFRGHIRPDLVQIFNQGMDYSLGFRARISVVIILKRTREIVSFK